MSDRCARKHRPPERIRTRSLLLIRSGYLAVESPGRTRATVNQSTVEAREREGDDEELVTPVERIAIYEPVAHRKSCYRYPVATTMRSQVMVKPIVAPTSACMMMRDVRGGDVQDRRALRRACRTAARTLAPMTTVSADQGGIDVLADGIVIRAYRSACTLFLRSWFA